jgi:superfamily II DNA or RNA helicase
MTPLPALEPYQTQAVDAAVLHLNTRRSGVLVAPAGSGKTWICAAIVEAIDCGRVLCLVPTQEIVGQMQAACILFGVSDRVDVRCYQGRPDAAGYDLLIIDEAHTAACDTITRILASADPDAGVLGVTATPDRPDGEDIRRIIGPIFHTVARAEVMRTGRIVSASVKWYDVPGSIVDEVRHAANRKIRSWMSDEVQNRILYTCAKEMGICGHVWRNAKAAELARVAMERGRSVLVLVNTIEQGKGIAGMIGEGAVVGYSGMKNRAGVIKDFRAGSVKCIVGTSLLDVGADLPIASVLVNAAGGRAEGRTEQRVGRICRSHPNKPPSVCCDFTDNHFFMLHAQAKKRMLVYRRLGLHTL